MLPVCQPHENRRRRQPPEPAERERPRSVFPHLEHAQQSQEGKEQHHRLQKNESGLGEQSGVWSW